MTSSTMLQYASRTLDWDGMQEPREPSELLARYQDIVGAGRLSWTSHHRFIKLLGKGGQGRVFLSERRGADGFTLPVAVKIFSPEHYIDDRTYEEAMGRIAYVSSKVALIQQDNLLDVQDFIDRQRIRIMVMEWVDGYDISQLLVPAMMQEMRKKLPPEKFANITRVVVTDGPVQPRMKPGLAVAVVRDCLAALAALHRDGVVHGDIKPSNIMLKSTGSAKIIDIGSAVELKNPPPSRTVTPTYAAPEVLDGGELTPRSDLASLGYVLVEMLSGKPLFPGPYTLAELLEAKRGLSTRLHTVLPAEVACNDLLMNFCKGLVAPDPTRRFPNAEMADLQHQGAAAFIRQLVLSNLAAEFDNEIRLWLGELKQIGWQAGQV